jgi:hypothetical protein
MRLKQFCHQVFAGTVCNAVVYLCLFNSGCMASRTPCKIAKPDPRIITHEDGALENPDWKCVPVGYNAQLKGPVFWCTNKVSGAVWQITILPVNAKSKD